MLAPIQGVDPRIAMKAAATQLSALKLFADSNGDIIAHSGVKVGSFTRDISLASGTQAITGVGFKPSAVIFFASISATPPASWGMSDTSSNLNICDFHTASANSNAPDTHTCSLYVNGGTDYIVGDIQSFDNDGFTVNWTKTGSPTGTGTIRYLAFR